MTRDFTVSVFIYFQGKVLLHMHKKLNIWLPVGGHIDTNELPQEAALREVKEECGLEIILIDSEQDLKLCDNEVIQLIRPSWILLENITPEHQHIDSVYMAYSKSNKIKTGSNESYKFKWVKSQDLIELDCPENVTKIVPLVIKYFDHLFRSIKN